MMNDPFSDFLQIMDARSIMSGGLVAGGSWAINFPPSERVKFWGVMRGSCWLLMEGAETPVRIAEGDVFLLSRARPLLLASDLSATPVALSDVLDGRTGAVVQHGAGDDFFMIGGKVELSPDCARLLSDALVPLIHIHAASRQAPILHWLLQQLVRERDDILPGAAVVSSQLAHLLFIQILRAHFESAAPQSPGWLRAVADKRVAPALRLMHGEPGRAWELGELAKAAAMSRAAFAAYFKKVAGIAPVAYLTEWRMRLAQRLLREGATPVAVLAHSLGYSSESAFSNAFKRSTGSSPKHYRNASQLSP
ncbi:AraC family transcriptional regulator [Janthinobacterium agaricidamnosum]|nr:AraC family transcriptional regulator [Janthinobacterium agaricidamnosum]